MADESVEDVDSSELDNFEQSFDQSQEQSQVESSQPESPQPESPQSESPQPESSQPDSPQLGSPQPGSPQPGSPQPESSQVESSQVESFQAESSQAPANKLIADIFGESDDDEAEFEGFEGKGNDVLSDEDDDLEDKEENEEDRNKRKRDSDDEDDSDKEVEQTESKKEKHDEGQDEKFVPDVSSDEDEDDNLRRRTNDDIVYDFDLMLQRKKEENYRRRRKRNTDIINDSDDLIADIIRDMKQAAEDDFENNKNRIAATRKLKMLPMIVTQLRKLDLRESFLDSGVLGVITDWLTPLPDRSLPHLQIRENLLKILIEFNIDDVERIRASGIGKAVMYLYKHPKETKENKKLAAQLISTWSRPIFHVDANFHSMSKEEREARDLQHMKKVKRMRAELNESRESTDSPKATKAEEKNLRPGDKGWVPRARVPAPSMKDYVVRPKSNVEVEINRGSNKRMVSRLDKHLRNFREKNRMNKMQRAVPISIEGRKMTL